mgnify:CR=1 FL=1
MTRRSVGGAHIRSFLSRATRGAGSPTGLRHRGSDVGTRMETEHNESEHAGDDLLSGLREHLFLDGEVLARLLLVQGPESEPARGGRRRRRHDHCRLSPPDAPTALPEP